MRRTVITRLQRILLLATVAITCGVYHSVKTAHGPGWSWWGYVVIVTGLILTEVILRSRTETPTEARARRDWARRQRWFKKHGYRGHDWQHVWLDETRRNDR